MSWLLARLGEPSTVNGLMALAGLAGVNLAPESQHDIVNGVGAAMTLYNIIRKERK